jgi:hypothetical protein
MEIKHRKTLPDLLIGSNFLKRIPVAQEKQ